MTTELVELADLLAQGCCMTSGEVEQRLRALASRAGGLDEVSAWRELYQLQTAMRYMDNKIGKRAAYRMAEEDVRRMTAQLAETAKAAAPEPVGA